MTRVANALACACLVAVSIADSIAADAEESFQAKAEALLSSIYTETTPGAAVVVSRDGEVLLNRGFGMAELELGVPMAEDHVLRLASVTKQYAAAAVLALVQDGKLALDDPISKYLPNFPFGEVTVAQLLNHTSGIQSYTDIPGYMDSERIRADLSTAELIAVFADEPPVFAPGERFAYNNSGYVLVGALIEEVSEQPWNRFLRERLLVPAGIERTDAYSDAERVPGRVAGYVGPADAPERAPFLSMTQPHAAGALMATASDVDAWQRALHGGRILDPTLYRRMITPEGPAVGAMGGQGYGYGLVVGEWFGQPAIHHGGGIFGFTTHALWLPEQKLSVVVLSNRSGPGWSAENVAMRLAGLAAGNTYPVDLPEVAWSDAFLKSIEGTYRIDEQTVRTLRVDGTDLISQRNGGVEFRVYPVAEDRLAFRESLSSFSIERDADGQVVAVALHSGWGGEPERAVKISDEIQTREAIEVPVGQLQRLIGAYELQPGFVLEVRVVDGGLQVQATGQGAIPMQAESPVRFYNAQVGATIEFELPESGSASSLTLFQGGGQMPAPRIEQSSN